MHEIHWFHWFLLMIAFSMLIVGPWWWAVTCRRRLDEWAKEHSYKLISAKGNMLQRGPYRWHISEHQIPFRFEVLDAGGAKKRGWAMCGTFKVADCIWDEEDDSQEVWNEPIQPKMPVITLLAVGVLAMMGLAFALAFGKGAVNGENPEWYPVAQGCFLILSIGYSVSALVIFLRDGIRELPAEAPDRARSDKDSN